MMMKGSIEKSSVLLRLFVWIWLTTGAQVSVAQEYAGFVEDLRNATSDSLMNINGMEYYLLYEDYEKVHFLSLLSEARETFVIGPAIPADTLYQNGDICARLGCEYLRRPLNSLKPDSMFVDNKYPRLFTRCETESPCNFKACDTNNFGFKLLMDFPTAQGEKWDYLRFWMINYIDTFTNMDMLYYDDVYLEKNVDENTLPTAVLRKQHPEAFEIDDINDAQGIADHFRDLYMRQVYYLKNLDFSFPLSYLRIFISPRFVSDRFVTLFISTNFYAYGAHDFPIERYITFDMKKQEVVKNWNLFRFGTEQEVKAVLEEEMRRQGHDIGDCDMPQAAIFGDHVVFSFQPYQIGAYADGISHFLIPKAKLKKFIQKDRLF